MSSFLCAQTFSDLELIEAAKMNCDEVPGWPDNLLSKALLSSDEPRDSMETDPNQVVPDLNGNASGALEMMTAPSSVGYSQDEDHRRNRSSSLSSWKSCSSLTSGYLSDESQTKSPLLLMDEELPLSPDRTLIDLDASSPCVLETLGPTGNIDYSLTHSIKMHIPPLLSIQLL